MPSTSEELMRERYNTPLTDRWIRTSIKTTHVSKLMKIDLLVGDVWKEIEVVLPVIPEVFLGVIQTLVDAVRAELKLH